MNYTKKPVIGITTDLKNKENSIESAYSLAIKHFGGIPFLIPTIESDPGNYYENVVNHIDGLLIPGSRDMDPKFYKQVTSSKINPMNIKRTNAEFELMEESLKRDLPILGICGGMQFINVFYGGSLHQDISECLPGAGNHEKGVIHDIKLVENTRLAELYGKDQIEVNSYHHQAIKDVGKDLLVNAVASDGIIEGIENPADKVMAVQWHPELNFDELSRKIFEFFLQEAVPDKN